MSAKNALNKFYASQLKGKSSVKRQKKNAKPEFEFKKIAKAWLEKAGFSINVVESKAVWSEAAGRYLSGQTDAGFSDIVGVTPMRGVACFIELKAPGKRASLKDHQREFLIRKIDRMAFAVVTDSIEHLDSRYAAWEHLYDMGMFMEAKNFLLKDLPVSRVKDKAASPDKNDSGLPF